MLQKETTVFLDRQQVFNKWSVLEDRGIHPTKNSISPLFPPSNDVGDTISNLFMAVAMLFRLDMPTWHVSAV